ncbi:MAG: hypothetical protein KC417_09705, partial [Myxococcales bacterium]|nr:hypothetical protein [Myxococcales bacterium]
LPERMLASYPAPIREKLPAWSEEFRLAGSATFSGGAFKTHGTVSATFGWTGETAFGFCDADGRGALQIDAELQEDVTTAHLHAFSGGAALFNAEVAIPTPVNDWLASATIPTLPPVRIQATMPNAPVKQLPVVCQEADGTLAATLDLTDVFTSNVRGTLDASSDSLQLRRVEPFKVALALKIAPEEVSGDATFSWNESERATATVSLPLEWPPNAIMPSIVGDDSVIAVDVADAPVAPFVGLLPKVDKASGRLDGVAELRGKPGSMEMSGEIRMNDGELQLAATGQRLTNVNGNFILHSNWIEIDGVEVADGNGSLRVDGSLLFDGWRPQSLRIALHGNHFPIRREGAELASLTGVASIEGEFSNAADLVVTFPNLAIDIPEQTEHTAQPLDSHPDIRVAGTEEEAADGPPYVISMMINASQPFWVRRNDFGVQVSA